MQQGSYYQNYGPEIQNLNFSQAAENNFKIPSQILNKNNIEEQNILEGKKKLLTQLQKKMESPNINISQSYANSNIPINKSINSNFSQNSSMETMSNYSGNNFLNNIPIIESQIVPMTKSCSQYLSKISSPSPLSFSNMSINSSEIIYVNDINNFNSFVNLQPNISPQSPSNFNNFLLNSQQRNNENLLNNYNFGVKTTRSIYSQINPFISSHLNLKIKDEQEKKDKLKKKEIIELHGKKLANYYEYPPEEKEKNIDLLLKNINYFGEIVKRENENNEKKQKLNYNSKYISIEDAIESEKTSKYKKVEYKNEFFVLALLANALKFQGCNVRIEREKAKDTDEEKIKELNTTIQFLANGMYNFIKYVFYFDFGEEKNRQLLNNLNEQALFNRIFLKKLSLIFGLKENDIILTNIRYVPYSITAIIKKAKFNELSQKELFEILNREPEFYNKIQNIQKNILLSGCILNPYMLDSRGNNKDPWWGRNEKRGGAPYYPPTGWVGYGIRVADRFDNGNNSWLDYNHSKGEWSVAYHGIRSGFQGIQIINCGINQKFQGMNDLFHLGQKVGEGMIVTPKPVIMEQNCGIFDCYGIKYKIGFMTRVMPKKIRCPEGQDDYWVINGTDNEIRPYRILIKEL